MNTVALSVQPTPMANGYDRLVRRKGADSHRNERSGSIPQELKTSLQEWTGSNDGLIEGIGRRQPRQQVEHRREGRILVPKGKLQVKRAVSHPGRTPEDSGGLLHQMLSVTVELV